MSGSSAKREAEISFAASLLLPGHTFAGTVIAFAPISALLLGGKLATFASYSYVSMSLAQTAKAMEPVFNVILAWSLYGEQRPVVVQLSLLPIVLGVALASISEPSFQLIGFLAAMSSGMLKVLQNIYTKRVMDKQTMGFFQIHLWCAFVSLAALAPVMAAEEVAVRGIGWLDPGTMVEHLSRHVAAAVQGQYAAGSGHAAAKAAFPWGRLVLCAACQYMASVASYGVLSRIHHLTFTIANTMKRLIIIGGGVLWFANPVTPVNIVGMALAISGVAGYNVARRFAEGSDKAQAQASAAAASSTAHRATTNGSAARHLKTEPEQSESGDDVEAGLHGGVGQATGSAWAGAGQIMAHRVSALQGAPSGTTQPHRSIQGRALGASGAGWSLVTGGVPPMFNGGTGGSPSDFRAKEAAGAAGADRGRLPSTQTGERLRISASALPARVAQEVTPLPDGEIVRVASFT
jgi:drug/metabolite transporter (DMT)-like permease